MTPLSITMNLDDTPWTDLKGQEDLVVGEINRIGLMPRGMSSGDPTVMVSIKMPDGTTIAAQTSWRLLLTAVKAMDVSPVAPKLRDIP